MGQATSFNGELNTLRAMLLDTVDLLDTLKYADPLNQFNAQVQREAIIELLTPTTPRG